MYVKYKNAYVLFEIGSSVVFTSIPSTKTVYGPSTKFLGILILQNPIVSSGPVTLKLITFPDSLKFEIVKLEIRVMWYVSC